MGNGRGIAELGALRRDLAQRAPIPIRGLLRIAAQGRMAAGIAEP